LALTLVAAIALTGGAATASAATAQWTCGADAAVATIAGQTPVDPITASRTPCAAQSVGLPELTNAVGLAPSINARSAYAITDVKPAGGRPIEQKIAATAGVEGLSLQTAAGTVVIGVGAAQSLATASCTNGAAVLTGNSQVTGLTINGQTVTLDGPLSSITDAISGSPLQALITVKLNEQVKDANGLVQRAAHIRVLNAAGSAPLADVIIAQSRVSSSSACDPNADGNAVAGSSTTGTSTNLPQVCPTGSSLDLSRGVCIISAADSAGQGVVVVGVPYSGPSGGHVISLTKARKLYKSPCLSGSGPKYVTVGTSKGDHITGTNREDRILGLGGADSIDGGRAADCIDGGMGSDNLAGGIGNDRTYGMSGNDHLNGGPGSDHLWGNNGNDTINAAYGRDHVVGGAGRDYINIATAGPPATVDCGGGPDKVRINRNERTHTRGCEIRYVFNDR
jgi:Ca2+-binding RTX toxin-like protein